MTSGPVILHGHLKIQALLLTERMPLKRVSTESSVIFTRTLYLIFRWKGSDLSSFAIAGSAVQRLEEVRTCTGSAER